MDNLIYIFYGLVGYILIGIINLLWAIFFNKHFVKTLSSAVLTMNLVSSKIKKTKEVKKELRQEYDLSKTDTFFETEKFHSAVSEAVKVEHETHTQEMNETVENGEKSVPTLSKWEILKNMWTLVANWFFVILIMILSKIFGYFYLSPEERAKLK